MAFNCCRFLVRRYAREDCNLRHYDDDATDLMVKDVVELLLDDDDDARRNDQSLKKSKDDRDVDLETGTGDDGGDPQGVEAGFDVEVALLETFAVLVTFPLKSELETANSVATKAWAAKFMVSLTLQNQEFNFDDVNFTIATILKRKEK